MVSATKLSVGLLAFFVSAQVLAAGEPGRAVIAHGAVTVSGSDGMKSDLDTGDTINQGDTIEVGAGSFARLMMQDGSVLNLSANTRVVFRTYSVDRKRAQRKASMKVFLGRVWARVAKAFGNDDSYTVSSENAVAGVRGTEFVFEVDEAGRSHLSVIEGSVAFTSKLTQLSELLGAMNHGSMDADGKITRGVLSGADLKALKEGAAPKPKLDKGKSAGRLKSVRERLGVEVTPTEEGVELPVEEEEEDGDREDPLDGLDDDPADPLLDLEPEGGATRVRGTVDVVQP